MRLTPTKALFKTSLCLQFEFAFFQQNNVGKKACVNKTMVKLTTWCQFHQHFMNRLCADTLLTKKLQSQTVNGEKL